MTSMMAICTQQYQPTTTDYLFIYTVGSRLATALLYVPAKYTLHSIALQEKLYWLTTCLHEICDHRASLTQTDDTASVCIDRAYSFLLDDHHLYRYDQRSTSTQYTYVQYTFTYIHISQKDKPSHRQRVRQTKTRFVRNTHIGI